MSQKIFHISCSSDNHTQIVNNRSSLLVQDITDWHLSVCLCVLASVCACVCVSVCAARYKGALYTGRVLHCLADSTALITLCQIVLLMLDSF